MGGVIGEFRIPGYGVYMGFWYVKWKQVEGNGKLWEKEEDKWF